MSLPPLMMLQMGGSCLHVGWVGVWLRQAGNQLRNLNLPRLILTQGTRVTEENIHQTHHSNRDLTEEEKDKPLSWNSATENAVPVSWSPLSAVVPKVRTVCFSLLKTSLESWDWDLRIGQVWWGAKASFSQSPDLSLMVSHCHPTLPASAEGAWKIIWLSRPQTTCMQTPLET
jgi:hypothetical protein